MPSTTKRVLIVEDVGDWRELLTRVIDRSGYQVIEASSELEAIHPDLILLDSGTPGMRVDQVIGELRMDLSTKNIPVIVQTTFDDYSATRYTTESGAKEVLHKPFDLSELPAILRKHLASQNAVAPG